MSKSFSNGFTIIETMLFLAVTGALIAAVMVGMGTSIGTQRYQDAVESFKSLIQTQYSEISSVKNYRSNDLSCDSSAKPVDGDEYRGQSDCVIVGRYMTVTGGDISIYTVLASEKTTSITQDNDIDDMKSNYNYNVAPDVEQRSLEWSTEIAWPTKGADAKSSNTARSVGLLFIKSPDSGTVYTFNSSSITDGAQITSETFTSMMIADTTTPGMGAQTICIKSNGVVGGDRAVYIAPLASSASAVETRTNELLLSSGGTSQC